MALPNFSVRRPVTVIMIFLGVVLFGFISWMRLPQELYPPITYPQLSVVTFYKDAAPEEMEVLVTKPVEEAVGTVSGVRRISSTSKEETSLVVAEFNWGTNMDFAALGVREKIDLIKESLPRGSDDPIVMKYNPFELPLLVLNITADKTHPAKIRQIVKKIIKNEIEKVDGVAAANITGGRIPEVLVEVDQDRLMSKNISLTDVVEFVSKANLNYPAGTIEESFYEYLIRTIGEFELIREIDDVVIGLDDQTERIEFPEYGPEDVKEKQEDAAFNKRLILLKDIAVVKNSFKDKTSVSRYNSMDNISVSVQKQADANTLRVANNVKEVISRTKELIPKDVHIDIVYDQSTFVKSAISGVRDAAFQGGVLAFLVLLLFLGNIRSAAIVALNIPISIMAVFSLMYLGGIGINIISLGGLALGVGMLVDNGIVVIENIFRHREQENRTPKEASIEGAKEVSGAIAGSTLTTIAVFFPMIFVIGIAGQLFKELAFTVIFSLLASLIAALTLIPILSSAIPYAPGTSKKRDKGIVGRVLSSMQDEIDSLLVFFIDNKLICLIAVLAIFIGACLLIPAIDTEFLPKIDQGQFIIKLDLPPGTKLEITESAARKIESYLFKMADIKDVTVNIGSTQEKKGTALLETMGPNQGQIIVNLKPLGRLGKSGEDYRSVPTSTVLQKLKDLLHKEPLNGADVEYILQESVFKTAFQAGAPVVVEVKGQDLNEIRRITRDIEKSLSKISGLYSIRNTLIDPAPEVKINIFKEKAANYNLSTSDIAVAAQTAVKGFIATKFKQEGEEIDVKVRLREQDRDDMAKVRMLNLHSAALGIDVPLAEVAYFSLGKGPSEIKRQDQERVAIVTANIFKRSFKEAADAVNLSLKKLNLSQGYSAELTGEREQIEQSFGSLQGALILSLILVYMIMASQFESLWQPFVILFTFPLSIIGVILILLVTGTPLSVMVILGVIILGGIVVNNGIVLIDYTNILRKEGMPAYDAVILASSRRLRPIIMTALTTILGLVPLALALNEGAELQQPMAIAVIGGLAVSTFLSLIVIPTIYLSLDAFIVFIRRNAFGAKISVPLKGMELAFEATVQAPVFPSEEGVDEEIEAPALPLPTEPAEEAPEVGARLPIEDSGGQAASGGEPKPEEKLPIIPEKQEKPEVGARLPIEDSGGQAASGGELEGKREKPEEKLPKEEKEPEKKPEKKPEPTILSAFGREDKVRPKKEEPEKKIPLLPKKPEREEKETEKKKSVPSEGETKKKPQEKLPIIFKKPIEEEKKPLLPEEKPKEKSPEKEKTAPPEEKLEKAPAAPREEVKDESAEKRPPIADVPGKGNISVELWDSLAGRQQDLIRYVRENRKITRAEYSKKFNISVPTAARDLKLLSDSGILTAKGPAAVGRYYVLADDI
ncbi:MAG: efflux RND transporter permease subunit [Candidatus Omnitrophota bacterium]